MDNNLEVGNIEWLLHILDSNEDEHIEFKEARNTYDSDKLIRYCAALANERGGQIILGITDKKPRRITGTSAFENISKISREILNALHSRVNVYEVFYNSKRVLIFDVSSRPVGMPVTYEGTYWMRSGESLVAMTSNQLKRIFDEGAPDFTKEICTDAIFNDLDYRAIEIFRNLWIRKTGNNALAVLSQEQLLQDAELIYNEKITYAALILFGTRPSLGRLLANAEVIFEYRSDELPGPAQQRENFRIGFFLYYDELWKLINLRNDKQHFRDGLFIWDIPTFNEDVAREAILNAISHRDYRDSGSVFIKQYPRRLEVISPGGFLPGITPANILSSQNPRNRRIAEILERCGLVERAGQGFDKMLRETLRESKPLPDYSRSDDFQVYLILNSTIQDPQFLKFLEQIGAETLRTFSAHHLLILNLLHRGQEIPQNLISYLPHLLTTEVVEQVSKGRHQQYILSKKFYSFLGERGVYTRKRGLDRETNKALLLEHIKLYKKEGSQMKEFLQVLPSKDRKQIQKMLEGLKKEEKIFCVGNTSNARWYPMELETKKG